MTPTTVTRLPLNQIASQQQDAIVFDVSAVTSIGSEAAFLIFYLSKEDEYNGYGTVIQLDPQTKQAAIYADLNPEYTYLFYKNEQDQLQTLLWCIEVASQTADGLFIAHAKSYGRGISAEDLKRFKQVDLPENQPQAQHPLTESYAPAPAPAPVSAPAQPAVQPNPQVAPQAQAQPFSLPTTPAAVDNTPLAQPAAVTNPNPTMSTNNSSISPQPASATSPAMPTMPATPIPTTTNPTPVAPTPSSVPPAQPLSFIEEPANPAEQLPEMDELNLPPLPTPAPQNQPAVPAAIAQPSIPAVTDILQPIVPSIQPTTPSQSSPNSGPAQSAAKQPVGRPPKPLMQDQLWPVSPEDFVWVKNMSRQSISEFKDALHQKVMLQIRTHKPGLMEDWQFAGIFEQAFNALCTTYELIPALRHDILKALLNGRVVDNLKNTQPSTSPF